MTDQPPRTPEQMLILEMLAWALVFQVSIERHQHIRLPWWASLVSLFLR